MQRNDIPRFRRYIELTRELEIMNLEYAEECRREAGVPEEERENEKKRCGEMRKKRKETEREMEGIEKEIGRYTPTETGLDADCARRFLRCRYILGLTVEDTAEVMHVSRDTANRIGRGLAKEELMRRSRSA